MSNHKICSLVKLVNSNWLILVSLHNVRKTKFQSTNLKKHFHYYFGQCVLFIMMVLCFLWCILFPALFLSIMWKCFHSRDLKIEGQSLSTHCTDPMMMQCAFSSGNGFIVCSQRVLSWVNWILESFTTQKLHNQEQTL